MKQFNRSFMILLTLSGILLLAACSTTYDPGYSSYSSTNYGVYGGYGYPYYGHGHYYHGPNRPNYPNRPGNPNRPGKPDRPSTQPVSRSSSHMGHPSSMRMGGATRMPRGRRR